MDEILRVENVHPFSMMTHSTFFCISNNKEKEEEEEEAESVSSSRKNVSGSENDSENGNWDKVLESDKEESFDSQSSSRGSALKGWASGVVREQRLLGNRWVVELGTLPDVLSPSSDSGGETMTWVRGVAGVDWGGLDHGTTVQLSGDAEDMHLFDGESGSRITKAGRS